MSAHGTRALVTDAVFDAFLGPTAPANLDSLLIAWAVVLGGNTQGCPDGSVAVITAELVHRAIDRERALGRWIEP